MELLQKIKVEIINPTIILLFGLALVVFLYGLFEIVGKANDPEAQTKGRQHIIWGVLGMAIMVSAFGIINLICRTIEC